MTLLCATPTCSRRGRRTSGQLRDPLPRVRKNMLMMLTHLILSGMVKVKGQISELALCLLDEDSRIVALTKLFFTELAKQSHSPVYNLLPDIVSTLSSNEQLASDGFREILGFLMGFLKEAKHNESMVDRLCPRFEMSDKVAHHRQIAFCLAALTHTEKSVRKLIDAYKTYGNKLGDEEVYASFCGLVAKTRKAQGSKTDAFKAVLDDLEQMLEESERGGGAAARAAAVEAATGGEGDAGVLPPTPAGAPTPGKKATAARGKGRSARGKAVKKPELWEEEEDDNDEEQNDENQPDETENKGEANLPPAPKARASSKAKAPAKAKAEEAAAPAAGRAARSSRRTAKA